MNKSYTVIIWLIILILIVIFLAKIIIPTNIENLKNLKNLKNIEIVISRYNENLDFLFKKPFSDCENITCYDKGEFKPKSGYPLNCTVIRLPNVGRCDHTYLYHIIKNYNKLYDMTVFLPASCTMSYKKNPTYHVLSNVHKLKTVLTHKSNHDYIPGFYDFSLDFYSATNPSNKKLNPESKLLLSPIRPFGKWYKHNYPELENAPIHYACWYGILSVSKKDILRNPIDKYRKLISYIDHHSNPEVGHYMERSWGALFLQDKETLEYKYEDEDS